MHNNKVKQWQNGRTNNLENYKQQLNIKKIKKNQRKLKKKVKQIKCKCKLKIKKNIWQ